MQIHHDPVYCEPFASKRAVDLNLAILKRTRLRGENGILALSRFAYPLPLMQDFNKSFVVGVKQA